MIFLLQLILRGNDHARIISRVFQIVDDHPLDVRAYRRHQMRHQIMCQRSFFRHLAHEHRDRAPDCLIDVNNKDFVAIPDKNRAAAAGGEHSTNMYLNDRFVHRVDGTDGRTKNKLLPAARTSFSGESRNGCFRERA